MKALMRSLLCRWRWIWSLIQTPLLVHGDPHAPVQLVLLLVVEEMVELLLLLVHSLVQLVLLVVAVLPESALLAGDESYCP